MSIQVRLLGPVQIEFDFGAERIASRKSRTLLALLAVNERRTVSLTSMLDELWPTRQSNDSRNACHAAMSRLRRIFGPEHRQIIKTQTSGYRLDIEPEKIDIHRFASTLRQAREVSAHSPMRAVELIDSNDCLWRGPALGDVDSTPTLRAERDRITDLRLTSLELRGGCLLAAGRNSAVIESIRPLSELHPGRERFHEQLMVALEREGRQLDALDVYRRVTTIYCEEFGIEPGRRLRELHQQILRQEPTRYQIAVAE
jgi:DNA-binding SARP family transcriptional activator